MRFFIIILLFLVANCSTYTVASIGTNIVTYSSTGKTNHDHALSLITGKDCKIFRIAKNKKVCDRNKTTIALNKEKETKNLNNNENKKVIKKTISVAYHITKNVIKDHAIMGASFTDTIKLTNELEKKIQLKFGSIHQPEKRTESIKTEIENEHNEGSWKERVHREQKKREKIKQSFLNALKKIKEYKKDRYVLSNIK